jgi:putative FmdB family regulatory protein
MAIYEFACKKCNHHYDVTSLMSEKESTVKKAKCEKCGSKAKKEIMHASNFNFTNPIGTDRWNSESGGHGYRFHHNLPKVIEERKNAELLSHMGADPYGQADMSANDIELDTGIHDAEDGPSMLTQFSE